MKKTLFTIVMGLSYYGLQAQQISTFDDITLPPASVLDGSEGSTAFESGSAVFPVEWDETYEYWSGGWAISNMNDSSKTGSAGLYYSRAGKGYNNSSNYAIGKGGSIVRLNPEKAENWLSGVYITNSAYAYSSMSEGDDFAKKFGGEEGEDPDFFVLTVKGWKNGEAVSDSVNFYLADFRSANSQEDYIVSGWNWVDLTALNGNGGIPDSLEFTLNSSDVGEYGMNTPGFFCLDHLIIDQSNSIAKAGISPFRVYPNPAQAELHISGTETADSWKIQSINGAEVLSGYGENKISLQGLENGVYILQLISGDKVYQHKIIKN
jgi:hypothetical protein